MTPVPALAGRPLFPFRQAPPPGPCVRLVGLSHHTAPVALRERLALPDPQAGAFMQSLKIRAGAEECVLLSTCNRVELYAVTPADDAHECLLRKALIDLYGGLSIDNHLYARRDAEAVRHLFHVAGGLDSLVIGETEILGQVKSAYDAARRVRCTGKLTNVLFQRAVFVGKRIRARTRLSEGPVSIPGVAVSLAGKALGDLSRRRALVVGAGAMAERTLRALQSQRTGDMVVANRTLDTAVALARRYGARPAPLSAVPFHLTQADMVICSTGSPLPIFRKSAVSRCLRARPERPLLFIDIAVPRDVDPAVGELNGVHLYNMDHLQDIFNSGRTQREDAAGHALDMAAAQARQFAAYYEAWRSGRVLALRHRDERDTPAQALSLAEPVF